MKTKYSTKRIFIRMSWNKYNLFNVIKYYKYNFYMPKKRLRLRNIIYKNKLLAKQRLRRFYGNLSEKELKGLLKLSAWYRNKFSIRYESRLIKNYLLINLERRLDAVLFHLKWAPTIFASRQLINHGHVLVNDKIIKSAGYILSANEFIQINKKSINFVNKLRDNYNNQYLKVLLKVGDHIKGEDQINGEKNIWFTSLRNIPKYLIENSENFSAIFVSIPKLKEIEYPFNTKAHLINRFYKKIRY
jgi:small subunit ribosomal protein S4